MNAVNLDVTLDERNLRRLRLLARASRLEGAKALTFTAEKAVGPWRAGNAVFHRRNTWLDKGVRMRAATPSTMTAQVGTLDKFFGRHVVGIGEEKHSGTGRLLVPTAPAASQGTHTKLRRTLKGYDRTKRKTFVMRTANGKVLIVRRKSKKRTPIEVLASLQQGVHIDDRFDALRIVSGVVNREFGPVYERLLLAWAAKQG